MDDLIANAEAWLKQALDQAHTLDTNAIAEGRRMAQQVREHAIDLAYRRATDGSRQIPEAQLLAAKIALLVFGSESSANLVYQREIDYYRSYAEAAWIYQAYDDFKLNITI